MSRHCNQPVARGLMLKLPAAAWAVPPAMPQETTMATMAVRPRARMRFGRRIADLRTTGFLPCLGDIRAESRWTHRQTAVSLPSARDPAVGADVRRIGPLGQLPGITGD